MAEGGGQTAPVVWFVGLPGSGKSSLARAVYDELAARGLDVVHLQMDERRKAYFPNPTYSTQEREEAYRLFAREAAELQARGKTVLMDGSAPEVRMRRFARELCPDFVEVFVSCPLEIAMQREAGRPEGLVMAGLYKKALERRRTGKEFPGLGQVIGVDVEFEQDPNAELVVDSANHGPEQCRDQVLAYLLDRKARASFSA